MTELVIPTNEGTRFKYGEWDIVMFMSQSLVGNSLILGYDDSGNTFAVATIDGPYDDNQWAVLTANGMGNYLAPKFPLIKALLQKFFDTRPHFPIVTNATPFTLENFNIMLKEYVAFQAVPGHTYPTVAIVPYVPPA